MSRTREFPTHVLFICINIYCYYVSNTKKGDIKIVSNYVINVGVEISGRYILLHETRWMFIMCKERIMELLVSNIRRKSN